MIVGLEQSKQYDMNEKHYEQTHCMLNDMDVGKLFLSHTPIFESKLMRFYDLPKIW